MTKKFDGLDREHERQEQASKPPEPQFAWLDKKLRPPLRMQFTGLYLLE